MNGTANVNNPVLTNRRSFLHLREAMLSHSLPNSTERKIASSFLILVVVIQIISGLTSAIQASDGRGGRLMYYVAFVFTVIQDLFVGLVVPHTLIWVSFELLSGKREIEALTTALVGIIWYGPDRVQASLSNLLNIMKRWRLLRASLSPYHRCSYYNIPPNNPSDSSTLNFRQECFRGNGNPMKCTRRLRFWPWWSHSERSQIVFWQGRVVHQPPEGDDAPFVDLSDEQLRGIARVGIRMALTGDIGENEVRVQCAGFVADQARYDLSLLTDVTPNPFSYGVLTGYEGAEMMDMIEMHHVWTERQLNQLANVVSGIRTHYIRQLIGPCLTVEFPELAVVIICASFSKKIERSQMRS